MRAKITREKVSLILKWCEDNFGRSQYRRKYPKLRVYQTEGKSLDCTGNGRYGEYYRGTITIFLGHEMTVRFLCYIVCHEYKHYMLSDADWNIKHRMLLQKGLTAEEIMFKHPHEKICEQFGKKYSNICFKELKNQLYKS